MMKLKNKKDKTLTSPRQSDEDDKVHAFFATQWEKVVFIGSLVGLVLLLIQAILRYQGGG